MTVCISILITQAHCLHHLQFLRLANDFGLPKTSLDPPSLMTSKANVNPYYPLYGHISRISSSRIRPMAVLLGMPSEALVKPTHPQ
jgi:hypothetical protein